ncbi:MAG: universal stress protein [Syntrophothermus sp.]
MKKILVPVDFSGHTDVTCNFALEFARVSGAEILLFHTYFDQIIIADSSFPDTIDMSTMYNEELLKEVFHQSEKNMEDLRKKVEEKARKEHIEGVTVRSALAGGEIEPELRIICKEFKPDLVIIGSTGKGKTLNIWGKVSTFIIDHAKVPVLIIPESAKNKSFKKIMLASDLSGNEEQLVYNLMNTFVRFPVTILFTHFTRNKVTEVLGQMEKLEARFAKEKSEGIISFHTVEIQEDNQSAINQFICDNHIDLIAFHPHKHGLFYLLFTKKITKKNLLATNIPVVAVPVSG